MKDTHHQEIYESERTHWWYRVRRRMVRDILLREFPGQTSLRILDIGCGTGALMTELGSFGEVDGVDVSPLALAFCRERGISRVQQGSVDATLFGDETFDVVLALDVIEHVPDDVRALHEMHRVLKHGGKVIIFAPAFMFLWGITDVLSDHYRRYRLPELRAKAKASGFSIVRASYFNTFLFPPIAGLRLFVRLLHIKVRSENSLGNSFINSVLFAIFRAESLLLRFVRFPFGVSIMLILKKE